MSDDDRKGIDPALKLAILVLAIVLATIAFLWVKSLFPQL